MILAKSGLHNVWTVQAAWGDGAMKIKAFTTRLWRSARGATAIEYAMIAAGIAVVIVGAIALAGGSLTNIFNTVGGAL